MLKLSHLVMKRNYADRCKYDLNLERNTVGFDRKSLGFERKLVFTLRLVYSS